MTRTPTSPRDDAGFTLVEVLVTMAVAGLMMAIAVAGWNSWARAREHSGTAQEIGSWLRQAQQRAVTEGRATCLQFDTAQGTWTVFRGSCDDAGRVRVQGPVRTASPKVRLSAPAFTGPTGSTHTGVTFSARGTAWPGSVRVTRDGSTKTYEVRVEGLTGRVSLT